MRAQGPRRTHQLLKKLSTDELEQFEREWTNWARPEQLAPEGKWRVWLLLAGRGFGKTRAGAEWVLEQVRRGRKRIALVAPTSADVRDVMVEGESGLMRIGFENEKPTYTPSVRRIVWPNGAMATTYSADEPERLRGPQHDAAWCDELGSWRYPEAFDMLQFGLRLGRHPQCVITTTPKPLGILRELVERDDTVTTRGSTWDNAANLAPGFLDTIKARYEGTALGRQEIYAELLDQAEGALWVRGWFDAHRRAEVPQLRRVVVGVDPAVTSTKKSDETGIVAVGVGEDGRGYVLADRSGRYTPDGWARAAILLHHELQANVIVAERNNGGEMVANTIKHTAASMLADRSLRSAAIPVQTVWASKGKAARAEPVSALYEQGRISHVGTFRELEDQCCTWAPTGGDASPDRLDALVWAFSECMVQRPAAVAQPISLGIGRSKWAVG